MLRVDGNLGRGWMGTLAWGCAYLSVPPGKSNMEWEWEPKYQNRGDKAGTAYCYSDGGGMAPP